MRQLLMVLWVICGFSSASTAQTVTQYRSANGAQVTNIESAGNLAVTHDLGCIAQDEVKNEYTPADLFKAVGQCVGKGQYEKAVRLFVIAGAYGAFDKQRVADVSARQAITVLIMNNTAAFTEEQRAGYKKAFEALKQDSPEFREICETVNTLGPPAYHPDYMINHGMGAFLNKGGDPIVEGFDPASAWSMVKDEYLHCPV